MANDTNTPSSIEQGATVVVTHHLRDGKQAEYDEWLNQIGGVSKNSEGLLDSQVIKPIAGLTSTYTVILRFATPDYLHSWMNSPERARLIDKVRPLLMKDDAFFIRSGLDFWFTPEGAEAKLPVRWKQFLLTWSAIYPLSLGVSLIITKLLLDLGVPPNHYLHALLASGFVVALMVYMVMPRYTKLVQHWLFDH